MSERLSRAQRARPASSVAPRIALKPFEFHTQVEGRSRTGLRPTLERKQVWPAPQMQRPVTAPAIFGYLSNRSHPRDSWDHLNIDTARQFRPAARPKSAVVRPNHRAKQHARLKSAPLLRPKSAPLTAKPRVDARWRKPENSPSDEAADHARILQARERAIAQAMRDLDQRGLDQHHSNIMTLVDDQFGLSEAPSEHHIRTVRSKSARPPRASFATRPTSARHRSSSPQAPQSPVAPTTEPDAPLNPTPPLPSPRDTRRPVRHARRKRQISRADSVTTLVNEMHELLDKSSTDAAVTKETNVKEDLHVNKDAAVKQTGLLTEPLPADSAHDADEPAFEGSPQMQDSGLGLNLAQDANANPDVISGKDGQINEDAETVVKDPGHMQHDQGRGNILGLSLNNHTVEADSSLDHIATSANGTPHSKYSIRSASLSSITEGTEADELKEVDGDALAAARNTVSDSVTDARPTAEMGQLKAFNADDVESEPTASHAAEQDAANIGDGHDNTHDDDNSIGIVDSGHESVADLEPAALTNQDALAADLATRIMHSSVSLAVAQLAAEKTLNSPPEREAIVVRDTTSSEASIDRTPKLKDAGTDIIKVLQDDGSVAVRSDEDLQNGTDFIEVQDDGTELALEPSVQASSDQQAMTREAEDVSGPNHAALSVDHHGDADATPSPSTSPSADISETAEALMPGPPAVIAQPSKAATIQDLLLGQAAMKLVVTALRAAIDELREEADGLDFVE